VASLTAGGFHPRQWGHRPFRSPHHTTSPIALVGGGTRPMPGEVSLAHNGVLLLDELPEFSREAVEALREPMETAAVAVARAAYRVEYPARFQLIATMNPCPCGYRGEGKNRCRCTEREVERYRARISGPFLDRLDVRLAVRREEHGKGEAGDTQGTDSSRVSKRVASARQRQIERQSVTNARLDGKRAARYCTLTPEAESVMRGASSRLELSPRALQRILKVSRTIADLDASDPISADHLSEALLFHSTR
jgi:magnesium chelatase family protein